MPANTSITIDLLEASELAEAERIVRLAFGTFLGVPNPLDFMGDRVFVAPRFHSSHTKVFAARDHGRLIGSNVVTRWGSFGFFGPLTVAPDYWNRGVAQRLLESTTETFDRWGVRHTGLFTFAHSPKHVGLYQKFGYWPRYLTALMTRTPEASSGASEQSISSHTLLSGYGAAERERAIEACEKLTHAIDDGLSLADEMRSVLAQRTGDVLLIRSAGDLDAFAVCMTGSGSEGGEKTCYVKFAGARGGAGAGDRFDALLDACEAFASSLGTNIEAGVNLAREDAYRRMRAHGFRVITLGIAMHRPHIAGFNREDAYVIDDWR